MFSQSAGVIQIDKKATNIGASKRLFFQPKLSVNQPNDVYEQEADAMADKVMRMSDQLPGYAFFHPSSNNAASRFGRTIQAKRSACEEEEKLQRKEADNYPDKNGSTEGYIAAPDAPDTSLSIPGAEKNIIQRVAFNQSPALEDAEREKQENKIQRKEAPSIQRMEHVNSTDSSRVTATEVHPWPHQPPVGDDIKAATNGGSNVDSWVAYAGGPAADHYWCHGHTLGTFNDSLYSVYSGSPMQMAVADEYDAIPERSVQSNDIAVWIPDFDHSCVFESVVFAGSALDRDKTIMSTKNGRSPLQSKSLNGVIGDYASISKTTPGFFRHK